MKNNHPKPGHLRLLCNWLAQPLQIISLVQMWVIEPPKVLGLTVLVTRGVPGTLEEGSCVQKGHIVACTVVRTYWKHKASRYLFA